MFVLAQGYATSDWPERLCEFQSVGNIEGAEFCVFGFRSYSLGQLLKVGGRTAVGTPRCKRLTKPTEVSPTRTDGGQTLEMGLE